MKTVPLHGAKAAGRVALVDDEDYDLVMQYRWNVHEPAAKPGCRPKGPYAVANDYSSGKHRVIRMHCLIMGTKGIDHENHNGLDNRRSNLRIASGSQNNQNARKRAGVTSQYKGVCLPSGRKLWHATIALNGSTRPLGDFTSEIEAAYAYDEAARRLFGEFACTNFPEGPTEAMRANWRVAQEEWEAGTEAVRARKHARAMSEWWTQREPETCICVECGAEFQSRAMGQKMNCSSKCREKASTRRKRERRAAKRAREREAASPPVVKLLRPVARRLRIGLDRDRRPDVA